MEPQSKSLGDSSGRESAPCRGSAEYSSRPLARRTRSRSGETDTGMVAAQVSSGPATSAARWTTRSPSSTSSASSICCRGENSTSIPPGAGRTLSAPTGEAATRPFVPLTGNQYSVQRSVAYGEKPRCLKGVSVLPSAAWLNERPDCTSTYCPSLSVSSFSQIMPCRERPQIQIFLPSFSSRGAKRPMPKSSSCQ